MKRREYNQGMTRTVLSRLTPELFEWLRETAVAQDRSISSLIRNILAEKQRRSRVPARTGARANTEITRAANES